MSWFDTSGFATLAKSALKEAQKTIDKALDIKDEDYITANNSELNKSTEVITEMGETVITQSPSRQNAPNMGASIWGSFTGSFFENPKVDILSTTKELDETASMKSEAESLTDDTEFAERFSRSQLVVRNASEDAETPDVEAVNDILTDISNMESRDSADDKASIKRRDRPNNSSYYNRLSVISSESGGNSSESVEILSNPTTPGSNLTSPCSAAYNTDSVEVLSGNSESYKNSQASDSADSSPFLSPSDISVELITPSSEENVDFSKSKANKTSPDSVEIIPEDIYEDDLSIAEDSISYTSISESTATTVMEHSRPFLLPMTESSQSELSLSSDVPITRAPSRSGLHLALSQHELLKTDLRDTDDDRTRLSQSLNSNYESEGSGSEKTLIIDEPQNVKTLIEEAMKEKTPENMEFSKSLSESMQSFEDVNVMSTTARGFSPISSEKSDLVKIGSEQTSGHTSADELETTTSSDIEIISSPNGDSSSTHSRQSPGGKLLHHGLKNDSGIHEFLGKTISKTKGHCRELSEASSQSNNSEESENDRLLKRIADLMELLESRESKLLEIGRRNAELQEINNDLSVQLDSNKIKQDSIELCNVTEEYTQRLSALERKFQQAIREKDSLRKQLEILKQDTATRMSKSEIDTAINEREQIIKELREEGEKLSKQQLLHGNIIKKLRAKEKENDNLMKRQKEQIEEFSQEADRMKRSLGAKEDVERSQIEAINNLTAENKKLSHDLTLYRSQIEDFTQKQETLITSLDAAKKELMEVQKASKELTKRDEALASLESEKQLTENQNVQILSQLDDLRLKLKQAEQSYILREQSLRNENSELVRRLESAELRAEELAQSVTLATKPVLRQLEALQMTYNARTQTWEKQEKCLVDKLNETQTRLNSLTDSEKLFREETIQLRTKVSGLEGQLSKTAQLHKDAATDLERLKMGYESTKVESERLHNNLQSTISNLREELTNTQQELSEVQDQLITERNACETERRRSTQLQEALKERLQQHGTTDQRTSRESSPTLSLGRISVSESVNSTIWPLDDPLDCNSSGRGEGGSIYDPYRGHSTTLLESLQSTLKQRDGEVQQLNYELSRLSTERTFLTDEIARLTVQVESNTEKMKENNEVISQIDELQRQYDALLQMYGEKMEENQELKLDLEDVKEMYKAQIDELLKQERKDV